MSSLSMPAAQARNGDATQAAAGVECPKCHANLPNQSEYCLHCGAHVVPAPLPRIRAEANPWRTGALVAMVVGFGCLLAAALTSVVYGQQNVLDWQAVQLWRIQWLLAGVALFVLARVLQSESRPK